MMGIETLAFGLGGILLLIGLIGSGIEIRELRIPTVSESARRVLIGSGIVFIVFGTILGLSKLYLDYQRSGPPNDIGVRADAPAGPRPAPEPTVVKHEPLSPPRNITEINKAGLTSAVRLSMSATIQAHATLNPAPLHRIYKGEALREGVAFLEKNQQEGVYYRLHLESLEFLSFHVDPDGNRAEVRVVPTWGVVLQAISNNNCVGIAPRQPMPQTLQLERNANEWFISAIVFESSKSPVLQPCQPTVHAAQAHCGITGATGAGRGTTPHAAISAAINSCISQGGVPNCCEKGARLTR